jgi:hypothetical protein
MSRNPVMLNVMHHCNNPFTASVVLLSEFLAANPEVPGSIPGDTTFPE